MDSGNETNRLLARFSAVQQVSAASDFRALTAQRSLHDYLKAVRTLAALSQGRQAQAQLRYLQEMAERDASITAQAVGAMDTRKVSLTSRPSFQKLPQAMQLDMLEAGSGGNAGGPEALLLALGRSLDSLPADIANGIKNGKVCNVVLGTAMVLSLMSRCRQQQALLLTYRCRLSCYKSTLTWRKTSF